jgi:HK97 family phage portal protein
MGVLRQLAAAFRGGIEDRVPVDMTAGRAGLASTWSTTGSKTAALGVTEWNSTIFGIVDAQATAQARITWRLYRSAASGKEEDREEVPKHPALSVWERPNPFYTQDDLVEVLFNHYELTGEMWIMIGRAAGLAGGGPPLELWAVRPDRMSPVAHPTEFMSGYAYQAAQDLVPLKLTDVIFEKKQHPLDPYRGLSPIWAAMTDLRADREASEYNASFFRNDATPGGIIKLPQWLNDTEWRQTVQRWNEQHRGRGNAHRIHVMDNAKDAEFVDLKYSRKDMQFVDLRRFSIEGFMRAYRISNFVLGMLEDVNRATAEAADVWFGKAHVLPRAERMRKMLNHKFLPLFGAMGKGYEFDFDDPIPPDRAQAQAETTAAITNALALIAQGYDEAEVFEYFELPAFGRSAAPVPVAAPPVLVEPAAGLPGPPAVMNGRRPRVEVRH